VTIALWLQSQQQGQIHAWSLLGVDFDPFASVLEAGVSAQVAQGVLPFA